MDEAYVKAVTDAVWDRLFLPRALCVGTPPKNAEFLSVDEPPYDMVVLASLSPAQLLAMPSDVVCRALLQGLPVYLVEQGLEHRAYGGKHCSALYRELLARERYLRQLGVQIWGTEKTGKLYTAEDVRILGRDGIPANAKLTPLARDILEGKA